MRKWTAVVCALVGVHILVSLFARRSFALTCFGDLAQCALLLCATATLFSNVRSTAKKSQVFWGLMGLGCGMWFAAQTLWTCFEVFLRQETPNPFVGDVVLFLHLVPMMAAVAIQPHTQQEGRPGYSGSLDFALLLTWWFYLYLFVVIPWQYVYPVEAVYNKGFDALYAFEQIVLISGLFFVRRRSAGAWRTLYAQLLGAVLLYGVISIVASEAIDYHVYYTGSLFDVPLVAAMAWFAWIGLRARQTPGVEPAIEKIVEGYGIWKARLSMLSVFSTPLLVAWAQFGGHAPRSVRIYRLWLTVTVMVVMGALVFIKQHLLDRELLSLLHLSRQNFDEMSQLKNELENKEQSLRWHSRELQRKNLELQEISFTDSLTGVWNRRYLEEILPAESGQVLRNYQRARGSDISTMDHRDLVFLMVDMDFFKEVNDQYGHPVGDRLLQLVAQRLSSVVRKSDVLVRWGGEEFLIMNRSTDPSGTPAFCDRILEVIASQPFDLSNGIRIRKTCSVGWAPYPWCRSGYEAICAEEVIALADTALYQAKASGRNRSVGILPSHHANSTPSAIKLSALQDCQSALTRLVRTSYSAPVVSSGMPLEIPEFADKPRN